MSQAKVDRYKEEKRNREKIIKKQKREWMLTKVGMSVVALVMVAWVGVSVYQNVTAPDATEAADLPSYTVNTTALDEYLYNLNYDAD